MLVFEPVRGRSRATELPCFFVFLTKWPPVAILDGATMSVIEPVRDIWISNACVQFEERSLNPSKVIELTTELWCGGRRSGGGGCVANENIILPKTYVSREYIMTRYNFLGARWVILSCFVFSELFMWIWPNNYLNDFLEARRLFWAICFSGLQHELITLLVNVS